MKFYVVSEEELEQLIKTAIHEAKAPTLVSGVALSFASAACRARPVQQYDIYNPISGESHLVWKEVKR